MPKFFFNFFIYPVFGGVKTTTPSKPGANAALTANPGSKRLIVFTHRFFYSDFLHGLDWRRWPGWPSNLCMTELSFALIPSLFIKFLFIVERGSHVISAHQHFLPLAHCGRITKSNMKIGDFHVVFFMSLPCNNKNSIRGTYGKETSWEVQRSNLQMHNMQLWNQFKISA